MPRIPFATQSAQQIATSWSQQQVINFMARPAPPSSRVDLALVPAPGLTAWAGGTVGTGPIHVMVPRRDSVVVLSGNGAFNEVNFPANTITSRGTNTTGDDAKATGDASETQTVIVAPPQLNVINNSGALVTVAALPNGANFGSVAVVDGFAIYTEAPATGSSSTFWVSNLLAAQTIGALNFANAESATDGLLRAFRMRGDLWLFGTRTTEVWGNAGTVGVPFQRRPGGTLGIGTAAALSPCMVGEAVCWLGHDLSVYRSTGGEPQRISTFAIDGEIRNLATVADARGMSLTLAGHEQYVLTFPTALRTFVWDASTNLWHERQSNGTRYLGNSTVYQGATQWVGSWSNGAIMALSQGATTDHGATMLRRVTLPPLWGATRRAFMSRLELEVGRVNAVDIAQPVAMSYSDDGGLTFINSRSINYRPMDDTRLVWHRLGSFRQRAIRFDFPPEWPHAVYAADALIDGGAT